MGVVVLLLLSLFSWVECIPLYQRAPRARYPPQVASNPSTVNCTWRWFNQTLDHFSPGLTPGHGATFMQRYCIYDKFWRKPTRNQKAGPILFYTGNESPVEEYVNNTGLMWNLGPEVQGLLIFAEHRYEGKSIPPLVGMRDCMGYCTSAQALADYAKLITDIKREMDAEDSPVVAFGGSYGGMLSAWFRIKYPNIVAGAIAASAPIWGMPLVQQHTFPRLDGSAIAIARGVSAAGGATDQCRDNILASWPLIHDIGKTAAGRAAISEAFNLCEPLGKEKDMAAFIEWAHAPWFEMAEGDYPFPSTYITFAVGPGLYPLPAWPMRKACSHGLNDNHSVSISGSVADVMFNVNVGKVGVKVDWNETTNNNYTIEDVQESGVLKMFSALKDAVGVWYNVTGKNQCYGPGHWWKNETESEASVHHEHEPENAANLKCTKTRSGCWGPINCNENLHLVNTVVHGVGQDMYWPPNVPRNYTIESLLGPIGKLHAGCGASYASQGLYGVPSYTDNWSQWLNEYYGGEHILSASNIVFSNGLLDPWSAGGVLKTLSPTLVSVILDEGAHHLDLFFPTKNDPPCAAKARALEAKWVKKWVGM